MMTSKTSRKPAKTRKPAYAAAPRIRTRPAHSIEAVVAIEENRAESIDYPMGTIFGEVR